MADITTTATQVGIVDPTDAITKSYVALSANIAAGTPIYIDPTTGKVGVADANDAGKEQVRGIVFRSNGLNVDVCELGELYGFDLSGNNYDDILYLSDTAGKLSTTAGTKTVAVGRVAPMSDNDKTKVLRVFVKRDANW